ncbi:MAG: 5-formyltetrahydrofolate cyclo-ligase [Ignavibacteriales bacterium]|nr:5-formyltetrahydrofolate cyclo-ligase [Ignavibacteriales bacterium]
MQPLIPKSEVRKLVLEKKRNISPQDVNIKTDKIIQRLSSADDFVYAKKIHIYISNKPGEVDTKKIINFAAGWGKQIFLPKLHKEAKLFKRFQFTGWDNLVENRDGYLEPQVGYDEDLSDIDLIFVPATAVSLLGQRVGSGGGYYDRLLINSFATKYVVAFEFQLFDSIETDRHDVRVDKIITERRTINTREAYKLSFV